MDYKEKYEALVVGINGWLDKYVGDWRRGVFNLPFDKTGEIAKDIIKLVPELRESEDERTRKFICGIIDNLEPKDFVGVKKMDVLRWLEKQKEREPIPALDRGDEIILKAICEELKDAPGWVERIEGWYRLAKDAQQPEENTPIYVDAAKKYFDSWIEMHRDSPTKWGCFWEGLLYSGKLSKPADWTDADEKILKRIIEERLRFVIPVPGDGLVGVTFKHSEDTEAINWLKRRVTSRPQPKQEWSEEEVDAMVKAFSDNLPLCGEFQTYHDALVHTYRQGVLAAIKAIRPQPQWKPSEEQIKALDKAIPVCMEVVGRDEISPLESLYDDLKKL